MTLACRDAEQARAIAETGRNPRYLPHCDLARRQGDDDRGRAAHGGGARRRRRAERGVRRRRRVAPGRRADPLADEGTRPGDGRAALDARQAAGRWPSSPGPTSRTRSLATSPAAAVIASEDDQLALELQAAINSITSASTSATTCRRRALRGGEERDRARRRRCGRPRARRQRQGGARRARAGRDGAAGRGSGRQAGDVRRARGHGRPRRHVLVEVRPQPPGRRADRAGHRSRRRRTARSGWSSRA